MAGEDGQTKRTVRPRRVSAKAANAKLIRDLSYNVDRIIDLLPKEEVHQLFSRKLESRSLGLQSFMLDRSARISIERSLRYQKPNECKRIMGEGADTRWILFRLDSEGEYKPVGQISDSEADRVQHYCG